LDPKRGDGANEAGEAASVAANAASLADREPNEPIFFWGPNLDWTWTYELWSILMVNNHYFGILIMDGMTISHIVSIDHGSYGDFQNKHVPCNAHICPRSTRNNISILQKTLTSAFQKNTPQTLKPSPLK
jgi:hypothetical protein